MEKITRNDIKESVATGMTNLIMDFGDSVMTFKKMYDNVTMPIAKRLATKIIAESNLDEIGKTLIVTR